VFDLSPEKIMALLAVGLVVLGPHRLPSAARSLAQGLANARRLATTLTEPVHASLAEPRQHIERAVAEVRGTVQGPAQPLSATWSSGTRTVPPPPLQVPAFPPGDAAPVVAAGFDPAGN
jgi:Sec-independent protein translocase protein TatA